MTVTSDKQDNCFLPNFCGLTMVFIVVIIAQLLAFILVLVPDAISMTERWNQLGLISLFVQWCALASCAALCIVRRYIYHLSNRYVAIISYLVVLAVVLIVSEVAYWYVVPVGTVVMEHWHFVFRNVAVAFLLTGPVLRYFYVQFQWRQKIRAEAEARLQALQSRIRPHFLFNSMNTIASLTRSQPEQAEQAVENLSDLFRVTLRDARQFHTFREECQLCQQYLEIEHLRLGERLNVTWDIDPIPQDAYVPPLLIQPLLENAIYHGIEPRAEGGSITITGRLEHGDISLIISNPLPINRQSSGKGNQIAQQNIRDRLKTLFNEKGSLEIKEENDQYSVTVTWPYRNRIDEDIDS
jgi:two-component system sensor histidine kinase AlgZ